MFRPLRGLLVLTLATLALSACADSAGGPVGGSASPSPSPSASTPPVAPTGSPAAGGTSLTVEFLADGDTPSETWMLQCNGAEPAETSDAPDPAAACAVLAVSGASLFAAPDPDLMCTQNVLGMQRAKVTGTVNGESVDRTFSLRDGCEIGRWESLTALLGPAEATL